MQDYDSIERIKAMAKKGDPRALFEMARMDDELLPDNEKNPDGIYAWRLHWLREASRKGDADARLYLVRILLAGPFYGPAHQEAFKWLKSLEDDLSASATKGDALWNVASIAKIEHGTMLCEGLAIQRDCVKGIRLIKEGIDYSNQKYGDPGFTSCFCVGELYALGYAQPDEEPTSSDLREAIKYFEEAISLFVQGRDNPQTLNFARQYLDAQKRRLQPKIDMENDLASFKEEAERPDADPLAKELYRTALSAYRASFEPQVEDRRKKRTHVPPEVEQHWKRQEELGRRLAERLAREGW